MIRSVTLLMCLAASPAVADFDPDAYPPYETCALCHGLFGQSRLAKFPHLGGQKPAYITAQIEAFLTGARTNDGGQMVTIVTELQPAEIPVVVEWFSTQDPPPPSAPADSNAGRQLVEAKGCLTCHANDAENADHVPYLSAQHADYLNKQMLDFRDGRRTHSDVADLHRQLLEDSETAIQEIARYFAALDRNE